MWLDRLNFLEVEEDDLEPRHKGILLDRIVIIVRRNVATVKV